MLLLQHVPFWENKICARWASGLGRRASGPIWMVQGREQWVETRRQLLDFGSGFSRRHERGSTDDASGVVPHPPTAFADRRILSSQCNPDCPRHSLIGTSTQATLPLSSFSTFNTFLIAAGQSQPAADSGLPNSVLSTRNCALGSSRIHFSIRPALDTMPSVCTIRISTQLMESRSLSRKYSVNTFFRASLSSPASALSNRSRASHKCERTTHAASSCFSNRSSVGSIVPFQSQCFFLPLPLGRPPSLPFSALDFAFAGGVTFPPRFPPAAICSRAASGILLLTRYPHNSARCAVFVFRYFTTCCIYVGLPLGISFGLLLSALCFILLGLHAACLAIRFLAT